MGRRLAAQASGGRVRSLAEASLALGVPERIERAGLQERLAPAAVLAGKGIGVVIGLVVATIALPVLPGRLGVAVGPLLAVAGFLAPDALLERSARLRHERLVAALPDALDLLSVGAASGRPPAAVMRELSAEGAGPLAAELAVAIAGSKPAPANGSRSRRSQTGCRAVRSARSPPPWSGPGATDLRWPTNCASRRPLCVGRRTGGSRSERRARRRRSNWLSPSSWFLRSC